MRSERTRIDKRRTDRDRSRSQAAAPHADPGSARNKAWDGQSEGTGGEGFSKGYGGSGGGGTGPAGPEGKDEKRGRRQ